MMTRNYFHIEQVEEGKILVVPTTYVRPDIYLSELDKVIASCYNSISYVYFDFLIKNGTKERFYAANYKNSKLVLNSFSKIEINESVSVLSDNFFKKNINLLDSSTLSKAQKFILRRKLIGA